MTNSEADEPEITFEDAYGYNPFSTAAEDLFRFYFMNYWRNSGKMPPFEGVRRRVFETEWFNARLYGFDPDVMHRLYDRLLGEIQ